MYLTELPTLSNGLIDHGSVSLSSLNPDDRRRALTSWTTKQQQKRSSQKPHHGNVKIYIVL